ncbi:IS4 family transposase [Rubritalea tangerina]|uniref:IS4 family transposase n=1 Tax=Rubritalea tangerina TaxID=430798 RepID=UPI00361317B6
MKKQTLLPNFPSTLFATAQRKIQADIRKFREQLSGQSLTGYSTLFQHILPPSFLQEIDTTQRQRAYGFIPVFWAWLGQIIEGNQSCTKSVSLIQSWYRSLKLPIPSSDTSAYCKRRQKLNPNSLQAIDQKIQNHLSRHIQECDLWREHELLSIDGTSIRLMDTVKNQLKYPQAAGQKKDCGFPVMGVVAVANHSHGGIVDTVKCQHQKHDARMAPQLLHTVKENDIMLGDRAFCTYEFTSRIVTERKGNFVMRLHQARHRKLDWRKGKKISSFERLVVWKKPKSQPPGSDLSREQWDVLPTQMTVRYIKMGYENRAGDKEMIVVVTSLLDPEKYPGEEVAALYAERWQIEVKFRDIKTTMGMEHFAVKSPEMAHLTLQMMLITHNLIRCIMQEAAYATGKPVHEMSFQGIRNVITSSHESFRNVAGKPILRKNHYEAFADNCTHHVLDIRPYRREPRAIKLRPKNYQLLTSSRKTFREIPHRGATRKTA